MQGRGGGQAAGQSAAQPTRRMRRAQQIADQERARHHARIANQQGQGRGRRRRHLPRQASLAQNQTPNAATFAPVPAPGPMLEFAQQPNHQHILDVSERERGRLQERTELQQRITYLENELVLERNQQLDVAAMRDHIAQLEASLEAIRAPLEHQIKIEKE